MPRRGPSVPASRPHPALTASARIAAAGRCNYFVPFNGRRSPRAINDFCLRPLIDDPNSAEFERIANKYKAAVAKSKPLLEETYNDRNPNRFSESRKQPSIRDEGN